MRILIVGMVNSVHLARWVHVLPDYCEDVEIQVLASAPVESSHSLLSASGVPVHFEIFSSGMTARLPKGWQRGWYLLRRLAGEIRGGKGRLFERKLAKLLRRFRPDVVHSMETQTAGYLVASVLRSCSGVRPLWTHSTWGSDIFLFGRMADHRERVHEVLRDCDQLVVDCERDADLVEAMNVVGKSRGSAMRVLPVCAGLDLSGLFAAGDSPDARPVVERTVILVKGYLSWAGRALTVLRGLERCRKEIEAAGMQVAVFAVSTEDVRVKVELMRSEGFPVTLIEHGISEAELYGWFSKSRVFVAAGISDGTPVAMLEAMAAGCFPIQSKASAAGEWIEDGVDGLLIEGEDSDDVRDALIDALGDSERIDYAAVKNRAKLEDRIGPEVMANAMIEIYGERAQLR